MRILTTLLLCAAAVPVAWLQPTHAQIDRGDGELRIYVMDVEGGSAVLFVTPAGESVLVDAGHDPARGALRDVGRIMQAVNDAGLAQIDHFLLTHFHADHFGGLPDLAQRIPIRHFLDHGQAVQHDPLIDGFVEQAYPALVQRATRTVVKPGHRIPLNDVDWRLVTSGGEVLGEPLAGAGQSNPFCRDVEPRAADPTENAQSIGSVIAFGAFRLVFLGDLTWNKELDLMCPANRLGRADVFLVSHHGQPSSNSPALVHALAPRVAVMNNGPRKGGAPETMRTLFLSPGLDDIWQAHVSLLGGQEHTAPGLFVANTTDDAPAVVPVAPAPMSSAAPVLTHEGPAHWIKISARRDGSFVVTNTRNGFSKTYARN